MGLVSGLEILRGLCVGKTDPIRYESGMSIFIAFLSFNWPSWESLETTRDKVYRFRFMEFVSCVHGIFRILDIDSDIGYVRHERNDLGSES